MNLTEKDAKVINNLTEKNEENSKAINDLIADSCEMAYTRGIVGQTVNMGLAAIGAFIALKASIFVEDKIVDITIKALKKKGLHMQ